jgi:hypothetical protein
VAGAYSGVIGYLHSPLHLHSVMVNQGSALYFVLGYLQQSSRLLLGWSIRFSFRFLYITSVLSTLWSTENGSCCKKTTLHKPREVDAMKLQPRPAYSPDLAPSDFHLFRTMTHVLRGRSSRTIEDVEMGCREGQGVVPP